MGTGWNLLSLSLIFDKDQHVQTAICQSFDKLGAKSEASLGRALVAQLNSLAGLA